jgi:hypothetical protein
MFLEGMKGEEYAGEGELRKGGEVKESLLEKETTRNATIRATISQSSERLPYKCT